jgi:hypothetical protein
VAGIRSWLNSESEQQQHERFLLLLLLLLWLQAVVPAVHLLLHWKLGGWLAQEAALQV